MKASASLPILTQRLRIRPLRPEDLDALTDVYQHPLVAQWIGPHTREDVAREIALHVDNQASLGWSLWAVEDRASSRLIGDCGLQPLEQRGPEVELGYDFDPRTWGAAWPPRRPELSLNTHLGRSKSNVSWLS
jgi:ribosomal-protein-alanine N-acetyltransferase